MVRRRVRQVWQGWHARGCVRVLRPGAGCAPVMGAAQSAVVDVLVPNENATYWDCAMNITCARRACKHDWDCLEECSRKMVETRQALDDKGIMRTYYADACEHLIEFGCPNELDAGEIRWYSIVVVAVVMFVWLIRLLPFLGPMNGSAWPRFFSMSGYLTWTSPADVAYPLEWSDPRESLERLVADGVLPPVATVQDLFYPRWWDGPPRRKAVVYDPADGSYTPTPPPAGVGPSPGKPSTVSAITGTPARSGFRLELPLRVR